MPRIGIVGSANMDLVVRADHMPGPGENVFGSEFRTIPGGKGANQAVAAARLGAQAVFIGRVGQDAFGAMLLESLRNDGVDVSHTQSVADAPTGIAVIVIDRNGQNSIVVAPGANGRLMPSDIDALRGTLKGLDAILMQLEIPMATVARTIQVAKELGVPVIVDAGPPRGDAPPELFGVSILSPNEAEASALLGHSIGGEKGAEAAGRELLGRGAEAVVLKLGSKGALVVTRTDCRHLPANRVQVVDTTAAGDAFTAALAVYRAEGLPLAEAAIRANRAGALACTKLGAQPSMPTRNEVEAFR